MVKRIIYGLLVLIWMMCVFSFSAQNGEKSKDTSDGITNKIINMCYDFFDIKLDRDTISFCVRKLAHFSIYFLGGILIFNFVNTFHFKNKYIIIISVIFRNDLCNK